MSNVSRKRYVAGHKFKGAVLDGVELDFSIPGRAQVLTASEMARMYESKSPETAAEEAELNVLRLVITRIDGEPVDVTDLAGDALSDRVGGMSTLETLRESIGTLTLATDGEVKHAVDSLEEAVDGFYWVQLPTGELEGVERRWRWAKVKLPKHSTIRAARQRVRRHNGRGAGVVAAELLYEIVRCGVRGLEPYTPQGEERDDPERDREEVVEAFHSGRLKGDHIESYLSPREQSLLAQVLAIASTSKPRVASDFLESLERGGPEAES